MSTCPLCKSEVERIDRVALDLGVLWVDGKRINLTGQEGGFIEGIISAYPRAASQDFIITTMYPNPSNEPEYDKFLDVYAFKLRKKTKGTALKIITVWGHGYRMELEEMNG